MFMVSICSKNKKKPRVEPRWLLHTYHPPWTLNGGTWQRPKVSSRVDCQLPPSYCRLPYRMCALIVCVSPFFFVVSLDGAVLCVSIYRRTIETTKTIRTEER